MSNTKKLPMEMNHEPGWYSWGNGHRYFDGYDWTQHYTPLPAAQPLTVIVADNGGPNHLLHAVLSLFTCGMWLPVWLLIIFCDWIAKMTSGYNREMRNA